MGACAQIDVFTYAVMRRTPRYEIRLAAPFADNLMNSEAHCGELPINVERPLRHIYELGAWLVAVEASTRTNSRSGRGSSGSSVLWKVCKKGKLITQNSNTAWKMPFEIQAVIFEQNSGKYFFFYCFGILFRVTGGIFLKEYAERGQ